MSWSQQTASVRVQSILYSLLGCSHPATLSLQGAPPVLSHLPRPPPSFQLSREVSAVGVELAGRVQSGICLCHPATSGGARQERRQMEF